MAGQAEPPPLGRTLLRRRAGHGAAVGFVDRLRQLPNVEVCHVDDS
ncbi:MAG TPA: hypothetical protein VMZ51_05335 [Acidimicrobiales bacterium]|nr:hypothetical protein [Acidimicrobiales bacterium]